MPILVLDVSVVAVVARVHAKPIALVALVGASIARVVWSRGGSGRWGRRERVLALAIVFAYAARTVNVLVAVLSAFTPRAAIIEITAAIDTRFAVILLAVIA